MEIEACTPQRSGVMADPGTHFSTQKRLFDFSRKLFTVSVKYYLSDAPTTEFCRLIRKEINTRSLQFETTNELYVLQR